MNEKEKYTWAKKFPDCRHKQEREDVVFVFPDEFEKSPGATTDNLQRVVDFLKDVTGINPTEVFKQRVVVGYSSQGLGWSPNRINVPLKYLSKPEEPLDYITPTKVGGKVFVTFSEGQLKKMLVWMVTNGGNE